MIPFCQWINSNPVGRQVVLILTDVYYFAHLDLENLKDNLGVVFPEEHVHIRKMALQASFSKRTFTFEFDARTSRGLMREKHSWYIKIWDDPKVGRFGVGECGPLPGLSIEDSATIEEKISSVVEQINHAKLKLEDVDSSSLRKLNTFFTDFFGEELMKKYPSVVFSLETAILDLLNGGDRVIFRNEFAKGKPLPINGLIWMGGLDFMLQQVEIKIRDGYRCVKLKVGGLDFEKECDILQYIRRKYFRDDIVIRLDANGAFKPEEAMYKLQELSKFGVHSIEQPLKTGHHGIVDICKSSPIPIALDEELIGLSGREEKESLLDRIRPQFIILKPTLHGGLFGCEEWIALAEARKIGWWITSALESNIGLNSIGQFTANYDIKLPQGLGTGAIYTNNFPSPLLAEKGTLRYDLKENWDLSDFG